MNDFKIVVSQENTTIPKSITYFMDNYINCLDPSFIKTTEATHAKEKIILTTIQLPSDLCSKFKEKTFEENIAMSLPIIQFMENYVAFTKKKGTE